MTKGIKLKFDEDDNAVIDHDEPEQPCFGNVVCRHSIRKDQQITWPDGEVLKYNQWYCKHAGKSMIDIKDKCPLGKWVTLDYPALYYAEQSSGFSNWYQKNKRLHEKSYQK